MRGDIHNLITRAKTEQSGFTCVFNGERLGLSSRYPFRGSLGETLALLQCLLKIELIRGEEGGRRVVDLTLWQPSVILRFNCFHTAKAFVFTL